jgi:polyhydroxyalkanoate synthase subunit PhaE
MTPFETMQALTEFWGKSGQAFANAQQTMFQDMTERMSKVMSGDGAATMPNMLPNVQGFDEAQQAFARSWSTAAELSSSLTKRLAGSDGRADPLAAAMLTKIFDPRGWFSATNEMDEVLGRMAEGPRLADLWNAERKFGAVFTAWVALRRRSLEHQTVMLDGWTRATGAFAKLLNDRADRGEPPLASWRELLALWTDTANETLLELQRSEAFLKRQRDLLKASTDLRLAQREVAEFYSEMFGYPTRAELDDVHRTVTELRRELRAMKRRERSGRAAVAQFPLAKDEVE